jgi:hypothetical protein
MNVFVLKSMDLFCKLILRFFMLRRESVMIGIETGTQSLYQTYAAQTTETAEADSAKKAGNYGKTIGNAKLSEAGAKYYEELKKKFSNMDFILVSSDQKANAQASAASYANASKMVVLIDEDKIERMATDENFRKQYEGIISNAASGVSQLKTAMESSGMSSSVQGYGVQVNDGGTASFFAVLKKSTEAQKERIEKKAEEKKEKAKAEEKKEAKKEREERLSKSEEKDDTVTITANSIDELIQKINDYNMEERSNNVQTDSEKLLGQYIDFRG